MCKVVGDSRQGILDLDFVSFGTYHQDIPVILEELVLRSRFDHMSPSFIDRDFTTDLFGPQLISQRTEIYSQYCIHTLRKCR
ncbi:unnamed protein product [Schistosoma margrebowiei]|uniref:Uncharacterized protein n=1 Tax=Schistosoma margrebowiei TaxID=48269 RepID=A0A183M8X1_9TREM|nr:unnamed protein product [Schistosoma margrebowiei]